MTQFFDDAPKREPEEDRLNTRPFARRLATALREIRSPNGYVVGLEGPWGGGKSTVLNFVKAYLGEDRDEQLIVVDYQPWLISGHQDLVAGYFKVLAEAMDFHAARGAARSATARRYAAELADPAIRAAGELVAALVPPAAVIAKPVSKVAGSAAKMALRDWAAEPSLQVRYAALRSALRDGRRRFVVFIDDIDRLDRDEIRAIAQMVKSVGSLPNVTYVLAYDRSIVRDALDSSARPPGAPTYDEKIIQHEVTLPKPHRRALLKLFQEHAEAILAHTADDERWGQILRNGLYRWLRSIRDVVRLGNALAFAGPALKDELDPADLLAIEGLRLFDPKAHAWILEQRDWLLAEGAWQLMRQEEVEANVRRLHEDLPAASRLQVLNLLITLFPSHVGEILLKQRPALPWSENHSAVVSRRGLATSAGFDAYLSLTGSPDVVAKRDVDRVMSNLDDRSVIAAAFEKYLALTDADGGPLIADFLEELKYRFEGLEATQAFLDALLMIGEAVLRLDDKGRGFEDRPMRVFDTLLAVILLNLGPERSGQMLKTAFEQPIAPSVAAEIYVDRAREQGVFPNGGEREVLVGLPDVVDLGTRAQDLIIAARDAGSLRDAPRYWSIVRTWKHIGDSDEARAWIRMVAEDRASDFAKIALWMLSHSLSRRGHSYRLALRPDQEDFTLEELLALAERHAADQALDPIDRARVEAFRAGLIRHLAERASDVPSDDDLAEVDDAE